MLPTIVEEVLQRDSVLQSECLEVLADRLCLGAVVSIWATVSTIQVQLEPRLRLQIAERA